MRFSIRYGYIDKNGVCFSSELMNGESFENNIHITYEELFPAIASVANMIVEKGNKIVNEDGTFAGYSDKPSMFIYIDEGIEKFQESLLMGIHK